MAGFRRPKRKHTGRGIAVSQWLPLGGESHAFVAIDADGNALVSTAMLDQGAGTHTAMRLVAAAELQLPLEKIRIATLDTSEVGPDTGIGGSRGTRIFANATRLAAVEGRERLLAAASEMLGVTQTELALAGAGIVRAPSGQSVSYAELARMNGSAIRGHGFYKNFESGPEAALCIQVAEVDVDVETGQVHLTHFTSAHSTGTVLNPLMHQAQIDGGVIMGMGYALMEGVLIDGGNVTTTHFGENKIPSIQDIPALKPVVQQAGADTGPCGGMSIGEPPVVPTGAAIANAVEDAVGARIYDLPITAEKVLEAIRRRGLREGALD